ncbi:unnamed protein product [Tilletia caries]|nr:unnamed protein product [Tilletia caries]
MADSPKRPPASHEGQLDLRTFLTSIHADLDAPASSTSSPSPTTTTPSLPASARVTLLDAQLDAVHAQIRHTLTKHADLLVKAGTESVRLHRDLSALSAQVDHFETETQPQIQDRAQRACAEIGIGIGEAEMTQGKEFGWLTRSVPALPSTTLKSWQKEGNEADLPAVRLLGPRLEEALRKKDAVLRRRAQKGRPTEHGGGGPSSKSPLSPADEVRRKARSLLQATEGWKAVSVLDVSAVAGSSDDGDDRSRLAPTSPLVGGRGMQLPSKKNAHLRPQQQQQQQPTCTISQRSLDLVTLAEETLTQARMRAKRLSREMAGGSLSTNDDEEGDIREARLRAIAALLRSLPDIFSLHLALMPTLHPVALFTDASLALQFANDCSHLSSQCVRLGNVLLIASNVREELGRLVNGRGAEGVVRKAVEGAAGGLKEVGQALSGLGLRVLNRQMMNTR